MHAHYAALFAQWYISVFLVGFGVLTLIRTDKMVDPKCFFKRDFKDREDRRRVSKRFWRSAGGSKRSLAPATCSSAPYRLCLGLRRH